jgi:hypothetical protein
VTRAEQALADARRNEDLAEDLLDGGLPEEHPLVTLHRRRAAVARALAQRYADPTHPADSPRTVPADARP